MQRIVIKNFGPIKDVDIPIRDFMIFIGPQASGKSTIAKAIYFFQELPGYIRKAIVELQDDNAVENTDIFYDEIKNQTETFFDEFFIDNPKTNLQLQYYYNDEKDLSLSISFNKNQIVVSYSLNFKSELDNLFNKILEVKASKKFAGGVVYVVTEEISDLIEIFFIGNFRWGRRNTFIPSGRSMFSILSNQFLFSQKDTIPYEIKLYASDINRLRKLYGRGMPRQGLFPNSSRAIAELLSKQILKGTYNTQRKNDVIEIENGETIFLENASSGQQEALWTILDLFYDITLNEVRFLIIEEPEAHLYPEAQKHISELIALAANKKSNNVIITTHSPYILSALNNLLYANEVGKNHPDQVEKVVDKNLWLDYDRVMAYFVDEGKVRSIMDDELRLIKSEEIDSASQIINREYDSLADIKFAK